MYNARSPPGQEKVRRLDITPDERHFQSVGAPDIIIPFPQGENGFAECGDSSAYAMAYVRPETNNVLYERAILSGLRAHGKIIYCANLAGRIFLSDLILEQHYPTQFKFARDPWGQLSRFPEIRSRVEEHFGLSLDHARLLGSFEAVQALGMSEEGLFETIVPATDYLGCWGQSFKRLAGVLVVNPNLPAIVKRHALPANVFSVVVSSRSSSVGFFDAVNEAVFKEITSSSETPVIDGEKLDSLVWSEKIRRTYHLSSNHLMAMFDMPDFVYTGEGQRLLPARDSPGPMAGEKHYRHGGAPASHEGIPPCPPKGFDPRLPSHGRPRYGAEPDQVADGGPSARLRR